MKSRFTERFWVIKYRVENEGERPRVLTTALHMCVNIKTPTYICTHTKMCIYIPHIQTKTKYGVSRISLPTNLLNQLNNSSKRCSHFWIGKKTPQHRGWTSGFPTRFSVGCSKHWFRLTKPWLTFLPTFFHIAHCHQLSFTVLSLSDRASICVFQLNSDPVPYVLRFI